MYELSWKRKIFDYKFFAALQGIDFDKEMGTQQETAPSKKGERGLPLFGDPKKDYGHLSSKERQKMTDDMLVHHRRWAGNKPLGGK